MEQKVIIRDFEGNGTEFNIVNIDKVKLIVCAVISGDEILTVYYDDDTFLDMDSCPNRRLTSFYEGHAVIPRDKIEKFNSIENSYDMLDYFHELALRR